jgi:hypothetical protein
MIVYMSSMMYASGYRKPLSLRGAAIPGGDVAISRKEEPDSEMFDESDVRCNLSVFLRA